METPKGATPMEQKQTRSKSSLMETRWYAHSLMTYKKKDNITQSYNPFLFIASVIQSKITRLTGKQDQMTEKLKGEKAKVNQ